MIFFNFFKYFLFFTLYLLFTVPSNAQIITNNKQQAKDFLEDLTVFTRALNDIKKIYVDEIDNKELFSNAVKGMVSGLDPHSDYLKPKEQKKLLESTSGKFGGLGIEINMKDKLIQVVSPIDDTPAYRAGIAAEDFIVEIDGKTVRGMSLKDGVDLMRGTPGTTVEITIVREQQKPFKVNLTREIITVVSAKGYLLEKDIGYTRVASFQSPSAALLKQVIADLSKENNGKLKGLILDLRNNPGGVLNAAVDISNLFIDKPGLVVYTKGRIANSNLEYKTKPGDIISAIPMVVLINKGSASASEIVAGALQDHKRAIIMGKTSFGKGSVQSVIQLKNGYGLKITTARYYTPSGRSIQAKGIEPDIILENFNLEEKEESVISGASEKDLKGHLQAEDTTQLSENEILKIQTNKKAQNAKIAIEKLKKDYFVNEASNLLKALVILDK